MRTVAILLACAAVSALASTSRKLSFQTWHADEEIVVEPEGDHHHEHHGSHHNCIHDEIMDAMGHDVHEKASSWVVYETSPAPGRSLSASYQPIRIAVNIDRLADGP